MKLSAKNQAQTQCVFVHEISAFCFPPSLFLAIRTRRVWASSCSLCIGDLQIIARAGNQLKVAILQGEGGWGLKIPCVHWTQHPTLGQLGRDPAMAHLRKGTKLASGSSNRESETLLRNPSTAPMRVCSGKQRFPVSPLYLLALRPRSVSAASSNLGTDAL